jgi:hypothetical protein
MWNANRWKSHVRLLVSKGSGAQMIETKLMKQRKVLKQAT